MEIFKTAKLPFYREKTFKDLKRGLFRFDFYLPNVQGAPAIVEVDGEQHFKPIYGRQSFLKGQEHDRRKKEYAKLYKIKLLEIWYYNYNTIEELLFDLLGLNVAQMYT